MTRSSAVATGIVGLIAALLTGAGEFILHYDALARYGSENLFFQGISAERTNLGHFVAVLGAPLYLVGCWHIYLMLKPANKTWAFVSFLVMAYGFLIGIVWIGSRASISALINTPDSPEVEQLIALYDLRYETLLQVTRIAVLLLSAVFVWLTLGGRSHYPKWMAVLNPILLIVGSFLVFLVMPSAGKYMMPIALNIAFGVFFLASTRIAIRNGV